MLAQEPQQMALVIIINSAMVKLGGVNIGSPRKGVTLLLFATGHKVRSRTSQVVCYSYARGPHFSDRHRYSFG